MDNNTITLNIGMKTKGGCPLDFIKHVRPAIHQAGLGPVLYGTTVPTPGEATAVVVIPDDGRSYRDRVLKLADLLEQDCIAWFFRLHGVLTGPGAATYRPFNQSKFITKEQAMSYGSPSNPQGRSDEAFDIRNLHKHVQALAQSRSADHATLQHLLGRVTTLETKTSERVPTSTPAAEPTPQVEFTEEELSVIYGVFQHLCGTGPGCSSIWAKLRKLNLPPVGDIFTYGHGRQCPGIWDADSKHPIVVGGTNCAPHSQH